MVLEEVSSDAGGFPADESTNYDPDHGRQTLGEQFSIKTRNGEMTVPFPAYIDLKEYPRPLPFFKNVLGMDDSTLKRFILTIGVDRERIMGRQMRREEWEATTYHLAKLTATGSFGTPLGLAAGLWRAQDTKKEFKFPFFKPDQNNLQVFRRLSILGLQGSKAETAWHMIRRAAYIGISVPIARMLVGGYALAVSFTGTAYDPRLKDYQAMLRKQAIDKFEGSRQGRADLPQRQRQSPQPAKVTQYEEASPSQDQEWSYGDSTARTASRLSSFDDASPTAGSDPIQPISPQAPETAWERIRRGNAPLPQPHQDQGRGTPPITGGDAWARVRGSGRSQDQGSPQQSQMETRSDGSLSEWDKAQTEREDRMAKEDERRLARETAQQEFDAQVERERNGMGAETDSPRGGGGGWRR